MNIKRLVLGTAAGALAVTGVSSAQAADLPVVVDPVDYVRICDAYGNGYYFIPGTETCIRLAGRVRADYNVFFDFEDDLDRPATYGTPTFVDGDGDGIADDLDGDGDIDDDDLIGNIAFPPNNFFDGDLTGGFGFDNANDIGYRFRARGYIYLESRTATEFGLLRTFTEVQFTNDNNDLGVNLDSAVIQFGGLIFGRTDSLYDFNDADISAAQFFSYLHSDTKTNLIGYQAAFGNGFSAAISLEDASTRFSGIAQFTGEFNVTPTVFDRQANEQIPDIVGNIRVDQGWGSAQLMAAGHYVEAVGITFNDDSGLRGDGQEDEYGFAIGAGVSVNIPFGQGTSAALTGTYARGALSYAAAGAAGPGAADAVIDPGGNLELGDFFSVSGGVSTSFTPTVALALQAGYLYMDHEDVQMDPGNFAGLESLDTSNISLQGFLGYSPVSGMTFGVGAEYLYVDTDDFGETSALSTFFRAQRTF